MKPFIYVHELLSNGAGIWIGCDSESDVNNSYIEGKTGKEVIALVKLSDAEAEIAKLQEYIDHLEKCV